MSVPDGPPAPPVDAPATAEVPKKKRRWGWIIAVILLALALIATGVVLALSLIRLSEARDEIDQQREEIKQQKDLIEKKETFASAASELMATAAQLDGLPYGSIVPTTKYTRLIQGAWNHRWDADLLDRDIEDARADTEELAAVVSAAKEQAASNGTGTFYETITDQLGSGYVKTSLDTADATCASDVWGCVGGEDPYTIHYDASQMNSQPYMSDWLRTGLAYHEYAHVLQMTNPGPTATAAKSFGDDWETMADCYALTELPGWALDQTIWVSDFEYWEVSIGYGDTCDEGQRQVIRDWVSQLGYTHEPISQ